MLKHFGICLFVVVIGLSTTFAAPGLLKNDERIVGGHNVSIAKHPYQISMRRKGSSKSPFSHHCGGSIIRNNLIVTAAHCVYTRSPENFMIVAGTDNRKGGDGAVALVSKIIIHEAYNPYIYDNDIALMFLSMPLSINNVTLATISLAEEPPKHGTMASVTGWGATSSGGYSSDKLLEVEVPLISNEECDADYAKYYGPGRISENMLCAGFRGVGGKDSCQGDSGGPLVRNNKLTGIVSWGFGCASPDFPGVYTNVYRFVDWVESKIKENA